MLKDITFGQFYDSGSVIHRMDPRVKMILLLPFITVVFFFMDNLPSILLTSAFIITVLAASKVPIKLYLKNMKAILPVLIFTGIINMFYGEGEPLFSFWIISVTLDGILRALFMASRIAMLIFISSALTYTTTPNDLTDAIESLLYPLSFIGLKGAVHTLAMMMSMALRFIPTLIEEAEKIMNAQKARGADLESGGLVDRVKALIPVLIPLFISAVRRSYELAEAMECRCYNGGEGKTRMKQMKAKALDFAVIGVTLGVLGAVVALNYIF